MFFFDKTKDQVSEDYVMINTNDLEENYFDPYDIILMYGDRIKIGELPETAIKFIIEYFNNYEDSIKNDIKKHLTIIYRSMMYIRYHKKGNYLDPELVYNIAKSIIYLNDKLQQNTEILKFISFDRLCYEVYYELVLGQDMFTKEVDFRNTRHIETEFNPNHILDLDYHLNNFKKWNKGEEDDETMKDFFEIVNNEIWRFVSNASV